MAERSLLAYGQFRKRERMELTVVAQEASLGLTLVQTEQEALRWLDDKTPHALLVDDSATDTEAVCLRARSHARSAQTPIISLSRALDDLTFAEVFNWGGDDAVRLDTMWPLLSRLRLLPREETAPASSDRGIAVVADPDKNRRVVRARALHNAGWAIRFALTAEDAATFSRDDGVTLLVLDAELEGGIDALIASAQQRNELGHVLLCAPRELPTLSGALIDASNAAVADGFSPPENVVFIANELQRGGASDKRKSRRLLYGTRVGFRGEGREQDDFGFTYNVSAGGLYVRTLAPPSDDRVWLELRPPRSDRWVRLEGEVVWRRPFGPSNSATVPPGFGVKLADATRSNMSAWLGGYREFQRTVGLE
jgi:DNA-binding response OmpR family regulator